MASWSSALDFGAHPVIGKYFRGHTVGVRLRVRTMIRLRVSVRVRFKDRVQSGGCTRGDRCIHVAVGLLRKRDFGSQPVSQSQV